MNKVNRFTHVNIVNQSEASAVALNEALKANEHVMVIGGTGSGKTTLRDASFYGGRVITVEDTPEISVTPYHLVIPKVNCDS